MAYANYFKLCPILKQFFHKCLTLLEHTNLIMRYFVLFLLVILLGCGKELNNLENTSLVEVITDPNIFPSVVMVISPGGRGICTGTFISPKAVLTATHCTKSTGTYRIISNFGTFLSHDIETLGEGTIEDTSDLSIIILQEKVAKRKLNQVSPISSDIMLNEEVRLVGFGCDDLDLKTGTGKKRTGLNTIYDISDYLILYTPFKYPRKSHKILGPNSMAGTCFGDSGGPLFKTANNEFSVVGICHAGGHDSEKIESYFINLLKPENLSFLYNVDYQYELGIFDICDSTDPMNEPHCEPHTASAEIVRFIKKAFFYLKNLFAFFLSLIMNR